MRLAGTCSRYSNSAMPQLTNAAIIQGFWLSSFRCAYHAKVIKILLQKSKPTVMNVACMVAARVTKMWLMRLIFYRASVLIVQVPGISRSGDADNPAGQKNPGRYCQSANFFRISFIHDLRDHERHIRWDFTQ